MRARVFNPAQEQQIVAEYESGLGSNTIADRWGVTAMTIRRIVKRCGGNFDSSRHGMGLPPMPEDLQRRIVAAYQQHLTIRAIAAQECVSTSTVKKAVRVSGVAKNGCRRKYTINHDFFREIDTPTKAAILGLIATDGSVGKRHLAIVLKVADRPFLERVRDAMECDVQIREYDCCPSFPEDEKRGKRNEKVFRTAVLMVCSAEVVRHLNRHGIHRNKTHTVKWWQGPPHLMPSYALGCMDGDGSIARTSRSISFAGNPMMVDGMIDFVRERTGVEPGGRSKKGKIDEVRYCALQEVQSILRILYTDAPICLDRKKERADIILAARLALHI